MGFRGGTAASIVRGLGSGVQLTRSSGAASWWQGWWQAMYLLTCVCSWLQRFSLLWCARVCVCVWKDRKEQGAGGAWFCCRARFRVCTCDSWTYAAVKTFERGSRAVPLQRHKTVSSVRCWTGVRQPVAAQGCLACCLGFVAAGRVAGRVAESAECWARLCSDLPVNTWK